MIVIATMIVIASTPWACRPTTKDENLVAMPQRFSLGFGAPPQAKALGHENRCSQRIHFHKTRAKQSQRTTNEIASPPPLSGSQ